MKKILMKLKRRFREQENKDRETDNNKMEDLLNELKVTGWEDNLKFKTISMKHKISWKVKRVTEKIS